MNKENIIIYGINGWIGRALLNLLLVTYSKENIFLISSSVCQIQVKNHLFKCYTVQEILEQKIIPSPILFHLSFLTKDKIQLISLEEYQKINLQIRYNATKIIEKHKIKNVFYASSGAVYNQDRTICQNFDNNPYGFLKAQDETYFINSCQKVIIARIFNIIANNPNKIEHYALANFIDNAIKNQIIEIKANYPVIRSYTPLINILELSLKMLSDNQTATTVFDTSMYTMEVGELAYRIKSIIQNPNIIIKRPFLDPLKKPDYYIGNSEMQQTLFNKFNINVLSFEVAIKNLIDAPHKAFLFLLFLKTGLL